MRFRAIAGVSWVAIGLASSTAWAAEFQVDTRQSTVAIQVFKSGVGARLAHDHVIDATEYSGTVSYDAAAPEKSSVSVEVKTAALRVDEPEMRKRYKLPGELSASDRSEIKGNMLDDDQLNAAKHPTISFKSTSVAKQADGSLLVEGQLTIRGVSKKVKLPVKVEMKGETFHGSGTMKFNQSAFGYSPYSALFGAIKNKDEVLLHVDLVATPVAAK